MGWEVLCQYSPEGRPDLNEAFYARETKICKMPKQKTIGCFGKTTKASSISADAIKKALFEGMETIAVGTSGRTRRRKHRGH
jgi:hypothetical protein